MGVIKPQKAVLSETGAVSDDPSVEEKLHAGLKSDGLGSLLRPPQKYFWYKNIVVNETVH